MRRLREPVQSSVGERWLQKTHEPRALADGAQNHWRSEFYRV